VVRWPDLGGSVALSTQCGRAGGQHNASVYPTLSGAITMAVLGEDQLQVVRRTTATVSPLNTRETDGSYAIQGAMLHWVYVNR
jgi:hypothetical protein